MEYSELADAFSKNDTSKINHLMGELRPRLLRFLHIHMNARMDEAEDCIQDAILNALETIKDGDMRDAENLLSYLLSSCRNNYLNMQNKKGLSIVEQDPDTTLQPPRQLTQLLDKERRDLLAQCIAKLSDDYRVFINYWFADPGIEAKKVAAHFKMSVANVWTKKHRILKKLNACYQKKIKK